MLRNLSEIYDTTRIASVRIADIRANMLRTDSARYGIKTLFKRPPIECPLSSKLIVRSGSTRADRISGRSVLIVSTLRECPDVCTFVLMQMDAQ